MRRSSPQTGFTLIELMVVLAIIAILGAIALPIYQRYTERSCRTQAKNSLYLGAQFMERYSSQNNGVYTGAVLPDALTTSPGPNGSIGYTIALAVPNAGAFTLTATRSSCATFTGACSEALTLNDVGTKGTTSNSAGSIELCWTK
jgi:type IV pilus assembly protein PilE